MLKNKRMLTALFAVLLVMVAVLATAGCVSEDTPAHPTIQEKNHISWYNYDIKNSPLYSTVNHTYAAKDNFYAYVNAKDILQTTPDAILQADYNDICKAVANRGKCHEGGSEGESAIENLSSYYAEVGTNTSIPGLEAELVRTVYSMDTDSVTRNKLGVTPVIPAVNEILQVSTRDELSALISSGGLSSLKEAFVQEGISGSLSDGTKTTVSVLPQKFVLTNPASYQNMTEEDALLYLYLLENFHQFLIRCGVTEEEATELVLSLIRYEFELATECMAVDPMYGQDYVKKINNPYTYEQLSQMAFPIAGDLKVYHDAGATRFVVQDLAWLNKINELYTPENLDLFKAAMLYNLFMTATPFLDTDMQKMYFSSGLYQRYPYLYDMYKETIEYEAAKYQNAMKEMMTSSKNGGNNSNMSELGQVFRKDTDNLNISSFAILEERALNESREFMKNIYIGMALGKVVTDVKVPAGEKEKYIALIKDILAAFKERLENANWLSDSTRKAALEKLSKIKVRALYPDDWSYYSYADVDYKNAGTFYNLSVQLRKHNQAELVKDSLQSPSASVWPKDPYQNELIIPMEYNAFYTPTDNSINILYGFLSGVIGDQNLTQEEILGKIGTVIGHEITHGFDPIGSKFDGDGTYTNWWTGTDRKNFEAKAKKIADYVSGFEARPGEYLKGANMTDETIADFGGLSVVLDLAKKKEGFDYNKFFTVFAQGMYHPMLNAEYEIAIADEHLPGMYRANVGVQQYDEFYRTYNVTKGDQMYLAPENRLTIW